MTDRSEVIDFLIFSTDVDIITNRVTTSTTTARVTETETDLPSELQDCLGGGGDVAVRPGQEVELSHGPRLPGLVVLQVERPHQVVLAPHVLRHQVDLEAEQEVIIDSLEWWCLREKYLD